MIDANISHGNQQLSLLFPNLLSHDEQQFNKENRRRPAVRSWVTWIVDSSELRIGGFFFLHLRDRERQRESYVTKPKRRSKATSSNVASGKKATRAKRQTERHRDKKYIRAIGYCGHVRPLLMWQQ